MQVTRKQLVLAAIGVVVLMGITARITSNDGGTTSNTLAEKSTSPSTKPPAELPTLPITGGANVPPEIARAATGMAVSSMIFTFFHESGHMLVSELKLPVTGPQEDVVDEFASFVLTEALKSAPEDNKGNIADIIYAGALSWKFSAQEFAAGGAKFPYYDEHPPDERRFYSVLCVATAADPLRFIGRAVADGVPQARLEKCAREYKEKYAAWNELLKTHEPTAKQRRGGLHKLTMAYGPVGRAEWGAFENIYRQGQIFQPMFDALSSSVVLPEDITVKAQGCDQVNAWWSPQDKTITLCHDLFQHEVDMFAKALVAATRKAQGAGGDTPAPAGGGAPAPPTPRPAGASPISLAGVWSCQVLVNGMNGQEEMRLNPDASFRVHVVTANGQVMDAWGRWSVQGNVLRADYAGPAGIPTPELIPFSMPSPTVMQTSSSTCQKIG